MTATNQNDESLPSPSTETASQQQEGTTVADVATEELAAALETTLLIKEDNEDNEDKDDTDDNPTKETVDNLAKEALLAMAAWQQQAPEPLRRVAQWIAQGTVKRILVLSGAGVSVAAGIPDFRTPGTGLYDNLASYQLPYPEAVFDVAFYRRRPMPFVKLASELWPGSFCPTLTHSFLTLLHQKGLLQRCYTQNIDGLEHLANLPSEALVECHGHFRTASCIKCGTPADPDHVRSSIVEKCQVPRCVRCQSNVKPDIVFFGEGLPTRFHQLLKPDIREADACLILGTSLAVAPVSHIPDMVAPRTKRILLNRELVGNVNPRKYAARDVFHGGDCDASIEWLAKCLGWWPQLQSMHEEVVRKVATPKKK